MARLRGMALGLASGVVLPAANDDVAVARVELKQAGALNAELEII